LASSARSERALGDTLLVLEQVLLRFLEQQLALLLLLLEPPDVELAVLVQLRLLHLGDLAVLRRARPDLSLLAHLRLGDLAEHLLVVHDLALGLPALHQPLLLLLLPAVREHVRVHLLRAQVLHLVGLLVEDGVGALDRRDAHLLLQLRLEAVDLLALFFVHGGPVLLEALLLLPRGLQGVRPVLYSVVGK